MEVMSNQPVTVILPLDLGTVAQYERHVFPLARHDGPDSNLREGNLLLSATLEEIKKIREMRINLASSGDFIYNTRIRYEALAAKRDKLLQKRKTYNPFKLFLYYRAARMFHAASSNLLRETKATSEQMQRDHMHKLQSVPSAEIHPINDDVRADAAITAVAISLPGGLDDDARQAISDAIISHASDLESLVQGSFLSKLDNEVEDLWMQISLANTDSESLLSLMPESSSGADESDETPDTPKIDLSSPQPITVNITSNFYNNSILSTNSNLTGVTVNHGSGNTGASVSQ